MLFDSTKKAIPSRPASKRQSQLQKSSTPSPTNYLKPVANLQTPPGRSRRKVRNLTSTQTADPHPSNRPATQILRSTFVSLDGMHPGGKSTNMSASRLSRTARSSVADSSCSSYQKSMLVVKKAPPNSNVFDMFEDNKQQVDLGEKMLGCADEKLALLETSEN